jgi:high-affinity iron transporter
MTFSFLVTVREGVEMALVVAILLGYLRSLGQRRQFRAVWMGVGVAATACVLLATALELVSRELDDRVVEAFEGFTMIFAVVILSGMALWMRRQAAGMSRELRQDLDRALSRGSMTAIVLLAATSVGREGLETTLFLFAGSTNGSSGVPFIAGGLLGFAIAALIGAAIYHGSSRLPLKQFFFASGLVVIVLGAGLLATSVTKLYSAAIITNLGDRPWDTEHLVSITSTPGKFLNTLLGYDSAPSTLQIGLYWFYLLGMGALYLFLPSARRVPRPAEVPGPAPGGAPSP